VWLFWCSMCSPAIIRLCCYIVYFNHFNNHNHIGVATLRGQRGCSPLVKDRDTLIEQSVTRINEAHRIIFKKVVYDEFMKQINTVRHSFNTTGTVNYRVQLAVPPSTNNNHNNIVFKKKLLWFNVVHYTSTFFRSTIFPTLVENT